MSPQARYWMLTIPRANWEVPGQLPDGTTHLKGQAEIGAGGYNHWQLIVAYSRAVRLAAVKNTFGVACHAEPTRSSAADDYVWKEDTRVEGTQFELGVRAIRRNNAADYGRVVELAKAGQLDEIPEDIFLRYYRTLKEISADYAEPAAIVRTCYVFWGPPATGKSRRAWEEAGLRAYAKDPGSKWWCGYRGQKTAVIDEFGGEQSFRIEHCLRWFDRYPVSVETKGSSRPLLVETFYLTSNIDPRDWYPNAPADQKLALLRRLTITEFHPPLN